MIVDWIGLEWVGMDWNGLEWIGWFGMVWNGLDGLRMMLLAWIGFDSPRAGVETAREFCEVFNRSTNNQPNNNHLRTQTTNN